MGRCENTLRALRHCARARDNAAEGSRGQRGGSTEQSWARCVMMEPVGGWHERTAPSSFGGPEDPHGRYHRMGTIPQ